MTGYIESGSVNRPTSFQKPTLKERHPMSYPDFRHIPITDDRGRSLMGANEVEPEPGSVAMVNGEFGSAWQRQFDDGLWRCVRGGRPRDW